MTAVGHDTAVVWVPFLVLALLHAVGVAEKKKWLFSSGKFFSPMDSWPSETLTAPY